MTYDSREILTAWKTFVGKGILLEENIRPEVARSWLRCKKIGMDPWSLNFPQFSKGRLEQIKMKNERLLKSAHPVCEYLMAMFNCNISICDSQGFIFALITPLDFYPRTYGTLIEERTAGNGSITITLKEKKPFRLEGYEHYRVVSQGYSGVSAPILYHSLLIGVLTMTNPFLSLPDNALTCCMEGAKMVSELLDKEQEQCLLSTANIFSRIIDNHPQPVIVLDNKGKILLTNDAGKKIVRHYDDAAYGSQIISDYLLKKEDMDLILNTRLVQDDQVIRFRQDKNIKNNAYRMLYKKHIRLPNGLEHILLVLETNDFVQTKKKVAILRDNSTVVDYIGASEPWKKVDFMVHKVAKYNTNVLLLGKTGTGKEVVARAIHRLSGRSGHFVAINCGAIPKELFASELFGYESGAFTGAKASGSIGKFEYANNGTLFLDEIGEMPLGIQVSLLRILQEKAITRIGSNTSQKCDVRIIAATNQDIQKAVREGAFRSDLYYRLSVIEMKLPLLKERQGDIPLLAEFFNDVLSEQLQIPRQSIPQSVVEKLCQYHWSGNVRELRNVIEKMLILSDGEPVTAQLLPDYIKEYIEKLTCSPALKPEDLLTERDRICASLEKYRGNLSQSARELGIARNTLYRKLTKYNIEMKTFAMKKP